jgi:quercetin dioxygenase-like cupin family protein
MLKRSAAVVASFILATLGTTVSGQVAGQHTFTPANDLKWTNAGVPGVSTAVVRGDMAKGASHFYLKYAAGFVAPMHHHSPDHYATTVTGNLVLIGADGKEQRLPPGSHFAFTNKAVHGARCEGSQDCVMFIDARSAWDVVVAKSKP